ncbi:MAG TPA: hypothetical protein PLU41_02290 [Acidobacteriota bacterium]|jgi:predicted regulator of Ras-like GTPase activity (Roadblock/LC7/MglB family)|nr:hypothetical protein [Acidobacteriota bacterium]HPB26642.1 hypothetical protein [Acidobacteriota bacterium]HQO24101.1 hypothetical protein [Acidobacteriota bacterium]HQP72829.1 hypothetical protein [Acidobacteriota bacterium]
MNLFRDTIEEVVARVEGALLVLIVGVDGIIIDRAVHPDHLKDGLNFDLLAAEYTSLLKNAVRTAEDVEIGMLQEMTIFTEQLHFLIKMITSEYFLMFILQPGGNFGRARYELKKAKIILEKDFRI